MKARVSLVFVAQFVLCLLVNNGMVLTHQQSLQGMSVLGHLVLKQCGCVSRVLRERTVNMNGHFHEGLVSSAIF